MHQRLEVAVSYPCSCIRSVSRRNSCVPIACIHARLGINGCEAMGLIWCLVRSMEIEIDLVVV